MASQQLGRATFALVCITVGVKILGFVEKQVIAYYFGADQRVDAFFVALSAMTVVFLFVREIVEPAFLPLFVRHLDAGNRERGWQLFTVVAVGILAVTIPTVMAGWLGARNLASWLAPGFTPSALELTARLIRVTLVGGVLLGLSSLTYITLNGYRRFALPAAGDLVMKAMPIVCALVLVPQLGVLALALGVLLGCAGRLLVHLGGLGHELRYLAWPRPESRADVRQLAWVMAPLLLGVMFSQLSDLADNYFASQLGDGAVAAKTYARKIVDLPILLLPYALSVVAYPYFSSLAGRGEWDRLYTFLGRLLRGLAIVFAYLSVATILLAGPIVTLLLERGAFDAQARQLTAWPLRLYAAGLVTFALEALLVPFYYALRDTRTPVVLGIAGVGVNITLTALWIGPLGVGGVAAALTVSKTLKVLLLAWLLQRRRNQRPHQGRARSLPWAPVLGAALRLSLSASAAAVTMAVMMHLRSTPGAAGSLLEQVGYLGLTSAAGAASFLAILLAFPSPERALFMDGLNMLRRFLRQKPSDPPRTS